ncbi:unnamed protein product [Acanthoscelides obtectus]|uniref:Endonuclease/exonuclease/phosphatase domain-containing protein n=1 Tax=Acanthoscelides obtectus TaxID=200917 RepID=A0A9P0P350_ACAOB|nr:unnamed protein product [Acanthoscelides obtectus]CAK1628445.1 hypothetical protein AOBTE_LOCUS5218 [Acanthoscelides obtectus]
MEPVSITKKCKIGHLNVRSLMSSFDAFTDMMNEDYFDILALTETWLSLDITMDVVNIRNFNFLRKDRLSRCGVCIRQDIRAEIIDDDVTLNTAPFFEQLWVKLRIDQHDFAVGVARAQVMERLKSYAPDAGDLPGIEVAIWHSQIFAQYRVQRKDPDERRYNVTLKVLTPFEAFPKLNLFAAFETEENFYRTTLLFNTNRSDISVDATTEKSLHDETAGIKINEHLL